MYEFDPNKDALNREKHSISLARAEDLEVEAILADPYPWEQRWRAFGSINGKFFCLIFAVRVGRRRAISLRRSHKKEYARYVDTEAKT